MTTPRINGLRSIELAVHDLKQSAEFYRKVWALEDVSGEGDTLHLRGTGTFRPKPVFAVWLGDRFWWPASPGAPTGPEKPTGSDEQQLAVVD